MVLIGEYLLNTTGYNSFFNNISVSNINGSDTITGSTLFINGTVYFHNGGINAGTEFSHILNAELMDILMQLVE